MLSLSQSSPRLGRREFMRIGSLGLGGFSLGGFSLPQLLQAREKRPSFVRDKTIVFLFMQGGPSQLETFDPKPDAPVEIRTATDIIPTNVPGLMFGSTFENLAQRANRMTVVRSYVPGDSKHDIKPIVSDVTNRASLGATYARLAGTNHPTSGLPRSVFLNPRSVDNDTAGGTDKFGKFADPGQLGAGYAPFVPGGGGPLQDSMKLKLDRTRLDDRRSLLAQLDDLKRTVDVGGAIEGLDKFQQQAFQVLLNGAGDAFDLTKEDARTIARYDTAPLVTPNQIDKTWTNYPRYVDHNRSLGKLMLLTRRLIEAGVGFITVGTDFVWDNHADRNNAGVVEGMKYAGLAFDHAVSNFLDDLEARGLSEKVLLVCCGEIGRTPRINARGGRDHWGNLGPLLLIGGGMPRGRVYGGSTPDGADPAFDPVTPRNLISTILNTAFDGAQMRLDPGVSNDLLRLVTENEPIAGLM